jgi:hypothetical protein
MQKSQALVRLTGKEPQNQLNASQMATLCALGEKLRIIKGIKSDLQRKAERQEEERLALGDAMAKRANGLGGCAPTTKAAATLSDYHQVKSQVADDYIQAQKSRRPRSDPLSALRGIDDPESFARQEKARAYAQVDSLREQVSRMDQNIQNLGGTLEKSMEKSMEKFASSMEKVAHSFADKVAYLFGAHSPVSAASRGGGWLVPNEQPASAIKRSRYDVEELEDSPPRSGSSVSSTWSTESLEQTPRRSPSVQSPGRKNVLENLVDNPEKATPASPQFTIYGNPIIGNPVIGSMGNTGAATSNMANHCEHSSIVSHPHSAQGNSKAALRSQYQEAIRTNNVQEALRISSIILEMD